MNGSRPGHPWGYWYQSLDKLAKGETFTVSRPNTCQHVWGLDLPVGGPVSSRWSSVDYPPTPHTPWEHSGSPVLYKSLSIFWYFLLYQNFYPSGLLALLIEWLVTKIYLHFKKKYFLNVKWKFIIVKYLGKYFVCRKIICPFPSNPVPS